MEMEHTAEPQAARNVERNVDHEVVIIRCGDVRHGPAPFLRVQDELVQLPARSFVLLWPNA